MYEDEHHAGRARYALTGTESGHVWGTCSEVEELFGWVPRVEVRGWVGNQVWLVSDDDASEPWLLEDAESLGRFEGTGSLVLTGVDDFEGPPEGYRGRVLMHDGQRWLGSCREFTRILPPERSAPPLVLRGLTQSDQLRAVLSKGTRRALDLDQAALEIRDDRGELLTERLLWGRITAWHPSASGADLIDLELDGDPFTPVPAAVRPLWERWFAGPPDTPGAWAGLDTRRRWAWLDLVQERACRRAHQDRPAGHPYELDGRHVIDEPGLYLALGEGVNGPGGYFGGCLAAVDDCLRGTFGYTSPATLLWRNIATARAHLSRTLTADGRPYDLFAEILDALAEGGMRVVLA